MVTPKKKFVIKSSESFQIQATSVPFNQSIYYWNAVHRDTNSSLINSTERMRIKQVFSLSLFHFKLMLIIRKKLNEEKAHHVAFFIQIAVIFLLTCEVSKKNK